MMRYRNYVRRKGGHRKASVRESKGGTRLSFSHVSRSIPIVDVKACVSHQPCSPGKQELNAHFVPQSHPFGALKKRHTALSFFLPFATEPRFERPDGGSGVGSHCWFIWYGCCCWPFASHAEGIAGAPQPLFEGCP